MPILPRRLLGISVAVLMWGAACADGAESQPDAVDLDPSATESSTTVTSTTVPSVNSSADESVPPTIWPTEPTGLSADDPEAWTVEIVRLLTHDSEASTQGLELIDGALYESTGRYGQSTLRRIDVDSGEVISSTPLDADLFGEGITRVDDTLIQLTWREETALRWRLPDLTPLEPFAYQGEGWGICTLDDVIVTTDGSNVLSLRDPKDFEIVESIPVLFRGQEVSLLNELECVDGLVLANVFETDFIVVIEPATGGVLATIDASPLGTAVDRPDENVAVLNGIADLGDGTILLGGKLWPDHVVVRLVPV